MTPPDATQSMDSQLTHDHIGAAPHPEHHREQAKLAEQQKQPFAAEFHLKRLLMSEPGNWAAKVKLKILEASQAHP